MADMSLSHYISVGFLLLTASQYASGMKNNGKCSCAEFEVCLNMEQCFTQFHSYLEVAKASCGRGKVFCRNNRNPCEIFQESGLFHFPEDGKCYQPLVQGPCTSANWLVTKDGEKFLSCQPKPCPDSGSVWMNGRCRQEYDNLCPGFGEVWVSSTDGSAVCECDSGFTRGHDGYCHQLFTNGYKGYCKANTIVYEINKKGMCVQNPCQLGSLPHLHSWKKFLDTPADVKCHYITEDLKECEVEINEDEELACGSIRSDREASLIKSCVGSMCCGKRRRWSEDRNKCVPNFFRG